MHYLPHFGHNVWDNHTVLRGTSVNDLSVGSETPAEFKQALRDAALAGGFDKLADLEDKSGLSHGTVSPAFSKNKPMPSAATIAAIVQAMHGDVEAWLARSRKVVEPSPDQAASQPDGADDTSDIATDEPPAPSPGAAPEPSAGIEGNQAPGAGGVPPAPDSRRSGGRASGYRNGRLIKSGIAAAVVAILAAAVVIGLTRRDDKVPGHTVVVQNEVAIGASDLVEDNSPSYLAARPIARCANEPGCKLSGTDLHTGDTVQAVCRLQGALLTNANVDSAGIKTNPNAAASALWYGIRWSDGRRGYINEVYIAPSYRGGLGLPAC